MAVNRAKTMPQLLIVFTFQIIFCFIFILRTFCLRRLLTDLTRNSLKLSACTLFLLLLFLVYFLIYFSPS